MSDYWLSKHVFVCLDGRKVILLDLKHDKYSALDAAEASPLSHRVPGWPAFEPGEPHEVAPLRAEDIAYLLERQLLTDDPALGKEATPINLEAPVEVTSLARARAGDGRNSHERVRARHVLRFLIATLGAAFKLRCLSMQRVVEGVTRRRERRQPGPWDELDVQSAGELVALFNWLRLFFFTANDACLFNSLALIDFLAGYGLYPHWVFGVRSVPFAAHCWVQEGRALLNDGVEHVVLYTPLMAG